MSKKLFYVSFRGDDLKVLGKFKINEDGTGEFYDVVSESLKNRINHGIKNGFSTIDGSLVFPLKEPEKFYKISQLPPISGDYSFWEKEEDFNKKSL